MCRTLLLLNTFARGLFCGSKCGFQVLGIFLSCTIYVFILALVREESQGRWHLEITFHLYTVVSPRNHILGQQIAASLKHIGDT